MEAGVADMRLPLNEKTLAGVALATTGASAVAASDPIAGVLWVMLGAPVDGAVEFDLLFRWFVGLGVDEAVWDHASFSTHRDRLLSDEIGAKFLHATLAQPKVKRVISIDHFSVDGMLIDAWASIKSFRRKDGSDDDRPDPGRNAERGPQPDGIRVRWNG